MNIIDNILSHIRRYREANLNTVPEGLCPVCWGYQQYDGKIRKLFKDKQIDVNNHRDGYTLIQLFVKQRFEDITLREGEVRQCPSCAKHKHC